ncbi:MAG: efflux RND transporter periplasmic adaptor subunit [Hyphomicrobiaceae bacterium]
MASILKKLVAVVLLGSLIGVVAYAMVKPPTAPQTRDRPSRGSASAGSAGPSVPVLAVRTERQDVPVLLEAVGTVRPLNTVTIKPQVDGRLLRVAFGEGQDVKAGDLLAEIDPATYKAALDQAIAKREITATQLANARRDYDRMAKIPGVMAQKTMDTQAAQVEQFDAQLKADDATIASARTVLGYTRITSPINGRTGLRLIDEGNLVRSGDAGLVTITEVDPIAVLFALPQQHLKEVQKAEAKGKVIVEALDTNGQSAIATGELEVIDNQIDSTTGTIRMKARFANAQRQLWPGQFVNVRIRVDTLENVVAVPNVAIQRGPAGTFVWVVGDRNAATIRPVETGLATERLAVVTKGLDVGDQVVTTGFARISEGARLAVQDAPVSAPLGFAPPPRARKGKGGRHGKPDETGGDGGKQHRERGSRKNRPTAEGQAPAPAANATIIIPQPGPTERGRPSATP